MSLISNKMLEELRKEIYSRHKSLNESSIHIRTSIYDQYSIHTLREMLNCINNSDDNGFFPAKDDLIWVMILKYLEIILATREEEPPAGQLEYFGMNRRGEIVADEFPVKMKKIIHRAIDELRILGFNNVIINDIRG
jgi:hypothetical protein